MIDKKYEVNIDYDNQIWRLARLINPFCGFSKKIPRELILLALSLKPKLKPIGFYLISFAEFQKIPQERILLGPDLKGAIPVANYYLDSFDTVPNLVVVVVDHDEGGGVLHQAGPGQILGGAPPEGGVDRRPRRHPADADRDAAAAAVGRRRQAAARGGPAKHSSSVPAWLGLGGGGVVGAGGHEPAKAEALLEVHGLRGVGGLEGDSDRSFSNNSLPVFVSFLKFSTGKASHH